MGFKEIFAEQRAKNEEKKRFEEKLRAAREESYRKYRLKMIEQEGKYQAELDHKKEVSNMKPKKNKTNEVLDVLGNWAENTNKSLKGEE